MVRPGPTDDEVLEVVDPRDLSWRARDRAQRAPAEAARWEDATGRDLEDVERRVLQLPALGRGYAVGERSTTAGLEIRIFRRILGGPDWRPAVLAGIPAVERADWQAVDVDRGRGPERALLTLVPVAAVPGVSLRATVERVPAGVAVELRQERRRYVVVTPREGGPR